jgi:hypothetical protein
VTEGAAEQARAPWWRPAIIQYGALELLVMRAAFAMLAYVNVKWETAPFTTQKFPNGLAKYFDLTWLAHHPPGQEVKALVVAGLVMFVAGWLPALGLLPLAFFATLIGTLLNSQGAINHSWQMVTMMLLAQMVVLAWPRAGENRLSWRVVLRPDLDRQRASAHAALVVIAASYVVCGLVKVIASKGMWIQDSPYLAIQLLKTHFANFYTTLQATPEWLTEVTEFLLENPNVARVVFGSGLLIELAGFVILISRRWSLVGGLGIIALHLSISKLMNLNFEAHMLAVLIFCVNVPGLRKAWRGEP